MSAESGKYSIGIRFCISGEQGHFIGAGRVRLLENIKKQGSITAAAREMKMSYRQAWQMVQDMNERAAEPLVVKMLGGKGGGGAEVTAYGERILQLFHELEQKIDHFGKELSYQSVCF